MHQIGFVERDAVFLLERHDDIEQVDRFAAEIRLNAIVGFASFRPSTSPTVRHTSSSSISTAASRIACMSRAISRAVVSFISESMYMMSHHNSPRNSRTSAVYSGPSVMFAANACSPVTRKVPDVSGSSIGPE